MNRHLFLSMLIAAQLSGCGTFAAPGPVAPASHHAQRRYDEAIKKGDAAPAEKGKEVRK